MKADDLNKLPRYITAPASEMWGPMPEGFHIANEDAVFVKLKHVEALFPRTVTIHEKTIVRDGVEYISVGYGGTCLVNMANRYDWNLHSWDSYGALTPGWRGNTERFEYFIKKGTDA